MYESEIEYYSEYDSEIFDDDEESIEMCDDEESLENALSEKL